MMMQSKNILERLPSPRLTRFRIAAALRLEYLLGCPLECVLLLLLTWIETIEARVVEQINQSINQSIFCVGCDFG